LNQSVSDILKALEESSFEKAEATCLLYVETCKKRFLEELSVNSATDFLGSVLLLTRIHASEKKPWKSFLQMNETWGAMRFLEDYIKDREVLAQTYLALAEAYAYANFFPEAVICYRKHATLSADEALCRESWISSFFYSFRLDSTERLKTKKQSIEFLGETVSKQFETIAKEEFSKQLKFDPLEAEECYLKIRYELEKEIDRQMSEEVPLNANVPFCVRYWKTKKSVLKKKYGLDWKSPMDCNPSVSFGQN